MAATAHAARARRLATAMPQILFAPCVRTHVALLSAGVLALWLVPSGAGACTQAEREILADHDTRPVVVAQAALAGHQMVPPVPVERGTA